MVRPLLIAVVCCLSGSLVAQDRLGVVVVAHGADSAWNAPVEALTEALAARWPARTAFLMGPAAASHRFQDAVAALVAEGADRIAVVPLLVSSFSGHYRQLEWLVGARDTLDPSMQEHLLHAGIARPATSVPLLLLPALDDAPEMAQVLADRVRALLDTANPGDRAVLLLGHGPNGADDHAEWMRAFRAQAARLETALGLADVRVGVVRDDASPAVRGEAVLGVRDLVALQAAATGAPVLVVPVVISSGTLNRRRLPDDLAGLPVAYAPTPLLPHPAILAWVERLVTGIRSADAP